VPAAKQPKAPKKPSKPKTPPSSPHLLPRCIAGLRAPTIPELSQHPDFTKKNVSDAKVILMAILRHASYWQVTKKLVRADTGFSDKRTTKALNYLRIQQMLANVVIRKDSKFHGWCFRVDLDGKVQKGGWVLHYSQETDVKRDFNARKQMRREKGGIDKPKPKKRRTRKTKAQKNDHSQYPPKQGGTDAAPLHSYNVIPVEASEKETLLFPLPRENFQSLPGDPQDSRDRQELQGGSESPTTPEVVTPVSQERQEEIKTAYPVSEDVLEHIEDLGLPQPDPAIAPTFYLQAQTSLEADRSSSDPAHHHRGRLAIEKLQQGVRPRKEAALAWFKANLPGWLLEDCLRPGEAITVMVAHKLVRKLHGGSLTLDHFARYWAAVQTERCKRLPLVHVVNLLSSAFAIKNEQDAEHATSAAARTHDKFGRVLYRAEDVSANLVRAIPDMRVPHKADTSAWAPDALYEDLQGWRSDQLTEGYADRFLWAARIYALAGYMGDHHACVVPLLRDVSAANITKQDVCRWFVESPRGRPTFVRVAREFGACGLDTFDVFGIDWQECYAKAWRLWVCLATVRESQLRIPYANMSLGDFCRH
jgi:hypothetical protein